MNGYELLHRLRGRQRVYGTLVVSTSPHWPTAVKTAGADFVFIDTEHIAIDRTTLAWMCQTYRALDVAPLVRVYAPDPYLACVALDNGAAGVIAPYVECPEQVLKLRGAVKLRPLKGDFQDGVLRGRDEMTPELSNYVHQRNAGNVLVVNIESVPALERLDEILEIGGPDAVLVGPHDLSSSLGVPERYDSPEFLDAVRSIIARCSARGIGVGVHFWESIERELEWAALGANLIVHSSDITLFSRKLAEDLDRFRRTLDETPKPAPVELAPI